MRRKRRRRCAPHPTAKTFSWPNTCRTPVTGHTAATAHMAVTARTAVTDHMAVTAHTAVTACTGHGERGSSKGDTITVGGATMIPMQPDTRPLIAARHGLPHRAARHWLKT